MTTKTVEGYETNGAMPPRDPGATRRFVQAVFDNSPEWLACPVGASAKVARQYTSGLAVAGFMLNSRNHAGKIWFRITRRSGR
jgi:hypothetical protein